MLRIKIVVLKFYQLRLKLERLLKNKNDSTESTQKSDKHTWRRDQDHKWM